MVKVAQYCADVNVRTQGKDGGRTNKNQRILASREDCLRCLEAYILKSREKPLFEREYEDGTIHTVGILRDSDIGEPSAGNAAAGKVPMADAQNVTTNGAAARGSYGAPIADKGKAPIDADNGKAHAEVRKDIGEGDDGFGASSYRPAKRKSLPLLEDRHDRLSLASFSLPDAKENVFGIEKYDPMRRGNFRDIFCEDDERVPGLSGARVGVLERPQGDDALAGGSGAPAQHREASGYVCRLSCRRVNMTGVFAQIKHPAVSHETLTFSFLCVCVRQAHRTARIHNIS